MARGRIYTAQKRNFAVAAAKTLIHLTAPANMVIEVLTAQVGNETNTTNDQESICLQRITSFDGSEASTALTPSEHDEGDPASSVTARGNVTANEPTYTSNTEIAPAGFPSLSGWHWEPGPDETAIIGPGDAIGLRWLTTPASSITVSAYITYREIGG